MKCRLKPGSPGLFPGFDTNGIAGQKLLATSRGNTFATTDEDFDHVNPLCLPFMAKQ